MARGPHVDSGSSQWYVNLADGDTTRSAAQGVVRIGTVREGLAAAQLIAAVTAARGGDAQPERIVRVKTSAR